jgi:hypothetical protein
MSGVANDAAISPEYDSTAFTAFTGTDDTAFTATDGTFFTVTNDCAIFDTCKTFTSASAFAAAIIGLAIAGTNDGGTATTTAVSGTIRDTFTDAGSATTGRIIISCIPEFEGDSGRSSADEKGPNDLPAVRIIESPVELESSRAGVSVVFSGSSSSISKTVGFSSIFLLVII